MYADRPITPEEIRTAAAFVQKVQFLPWRADAVWPDAVTCWLLAQAAQRELGGRELPFVNADPNDLRAVVRLVRDHPLRAEWVPVPFPQHLDAVLMSHHLHPHHIGVWLELDGGVVLHATEQFTRGKPDPHKPAVACDTLDGLRETGWRSFTFLAHRGAS